MGMKWCVCYIHVSKSGERERYIVDDLVCIVSPKVVIKSGEMVNVHGHFEWNDVYCIPRSGDKSGEMVMIQNK